MVDYSEMQRSAEKSSRDFLRALQHFLKQTRKIPQQSLNELVLRWAQRRPPSETLRFLPKLAGELSSRMSVQSAWNTLSFLEVALRLRKPEMGIYDHALHFIGGAQKYGCTIAQTLQDDFEITLIANKPIALSELQAWYDLDLSRCHLKIVPIPHFEEKGRHPQLIDPGEVDTSGDNPFHVISRESGRYDIFVNNGMLEMVYPLANTSLFVCHFPEREKSRFFYVDRYTEIIHNSLYTALWIRKRWDLEPHKHIYPPVDMEPAALPLKKENVILSVSRFDIGGNKQQLEMIKAFQELAVSHPKELAGWKLILVGGTPSDNPYLERIKDHLGRGSAAEVELKVNIPAADLKAVYQKAKIFWHFCGLNQTDPAKVEHFGMTVAEAMQNGCVPIIFWGGGQTEIIAEGVSGYLFSGEKELVEKTLKLLGNPVLLHEMSQAAGQRGKEFGKDVFANQVRSYFRELMAKRFSPRVDPSDSA